MAILLFFTCIRKKFNGLKSSYIIVYKWLLFVSAEQHLSVLQADAATELNKLINYHCSMVNIKYYIVWMQLSVLSCVFI